LGKSQVKQKGLDCPHEVKLSELNKYILRDIYPSNSTVKGGSGHIKNSKHSRKVFVFDEDCESSAHENCRSSFFKVKSLDFNDKSEKVYVEVDKFFVKNFMENMLYPSGLDTHPRVFHNSLKELKKAGVKVPTIYYMKPIFFERAKKNPSWIQFKDFYKREVEALLRKGNMMDNLFNQTSILLQDGDLKSDELCILNEVSKSKILQKDSPFYKLLDARTKLKPIKDESFESLLDLSKRIFPESLDSRKRNTSSQHYYNPHYYSGNKNTIYEFFLKFLQSLAKKNNKQLSCTFDLKALWNGCIKRYPLLHILDFKRNFVKDISDMINIYDVTFMSKKKLSETKKSVDKKTNRINS